MREAAPFREVQRFRQPAVVALVGLAAAVQWALVVHQLVLGRSLGEDGRSAVAVLIPWLLLGVALPVALWRLQLVTEVLEAGLAVTLAPLARRWVPAADIEAVRAVRYRPLRDFGGWGARFGRGGRRAYSTGGHHGVEVELRGGGSIVVGSRRPEALAAALEAVARPPG